MHLSGGVSRSVDDFIKLSPALPAGAEGGMIHPPTAGSVAAAQVPLTTINARGASLSTSGSPVVQTTMSSMRAP
jgi:hypothetical protein